MSSAIGNSAGYAGALSALATARQDVASANKRLQTGSRVVDANDDAAVFSISQGLKGDIDSYQRIVSINLSGKETIGIARKGVEQISDIITKIEAKFLELRKSFDDPTVALPLQYDINGYLSQIDSIAKNSSVQGIGLLAQQDPTSPLTFIPDGGTQTLTITSMPQSSISLSTGFSGTAPASYSFVAPAFNPSATNPRVVITGSTLADPNDISASFSGASGTFASNGAFSFNLPDTGGSRSVNLNISSNGLPLNGFSIGGVSYIVDLPPPITSTITVPTGTWVPNPDQGSFRIINDLSGTFTPVMYADMTKSGLGFGGQIYDPLDNLRQALNDARQKVDAMLQHYSAKQREVANIVSYVSSKVDALTTGLGAITDADLGKEKARLEAAKAKEQLSLEGFSIVNESQKTILQFLKE